MIQAEWLEYGPPPWWRLRSRLEWNRTHRKVRIWVKKIAPGAREVPPGDFTCHR